MNEYKEVGGYKIPDVSYVKVRRAGWFFTFLRWLGLSLYGLGFKEIEIRPARSLWEAIKAGDK